MAVRTVDPPTPDQWNKIKKIMERGQTPEQAKRIADGTKRIKNIPRKNF